MRLREFVVHGPEEQVTEDFEVTVHGSFGERFLLAVAVCSIVACHGPTHSGDGDIREVRQQDFQAVYVVGFRTGFRKEAGSELTEREIGLEPVRKSTGKCQFLLILFIDTECQPFVSGAGRFCIPLAIDPDLCPVHTATLPERHLRHLLPRCIACCSRIQRVI